MDTKGDHIRNELLSIQAAHRDKILYPSQVIDWARKRPKSALYGVLQWDDAKAAHEHRLWQVRRLIQLHVVSSDDQPLLVNLSIDRPRGGGYRRVEDVLTNREMSQIMLRDALDELERTRERYSRIAELVSVWDEVEKVKKKRPKPEDRATR